MTLTGIYKKSGKVTEAQHRSTIFEGIIKKISMLHTKLRTPA